MTLLSLASKQIWPQVLAVLHFRPQRLILLHSKNEAESRGPAERLKEFFEKQGDLTAANILLREAPHDDFHVLVDKIAQAADDFDLDESNCQVNLTGGNKLMVLAAVEWCRLNSVPAFYLELDCRLFPFRPQGKEFLPSSDYKLDPHLADTCEPIDLLRCQIGAAEIRDPGQRLTLKSPAKAFEEGEFYSKLERNFDFRTSLSQDVPEPTAREGDTLEYATAFALLSLGIPVIQRSVKLKSRVLRRSQDDEGELDLIFNWQGKLWLVDCKDKRAAQQKIETLRAEILSLTGTAQLFDDRERIGGQPDLGRKLENLLKDLDEEVRHREIRTLREDLLLIAELGGLLGRAVCVRKELPYPAARDFAMSRKIPLILKSQMVTELRKLLSTPWQSTVASAKMPTPQ